MLFKTIQKKRFQALVERLLETDEVIGPKRVATRPDGRPIYHFLPVRSFAELALEFDTTEYSAKSYFLPPVEVLSRFNYDGEDWSQEIQYFDKTRILLGLHACDINALIKLDKVFTKDFFPNPYYLARRQNTLIVGIDHPPCEGGFCRSLGMDTVSHGFDLFLTDLGDRYFVALGSDSGFNLLRDAGVAEVTDADTQRYMEVRREIAGKFKTQVSLNYLPSLLDLQFESPVWRKWGGKCLSCGSCAMVCPSCYCYDVRERLSMDFAQSEKIKCMYSCSLPDFALVAGGHNFRPDREKRLMYRYYHHHRGFVETAGEPLCVGCNRCGRTCLAGINPPDVIADLQEEYRP
jgi:sulfhydrogenase subunit beta (sulfur reductase)